MKTLLFQQFAKENNWGESHPRCSQWQLFSSVIFVASCIKLGQVRPWAYSSINVKFSRRWKRPRCPGMCDRLTHHIHWFFLRPITPPSEISLTSSEQVGSLVRVVVLWGGGGNSLALITHQCKPLWAISTVYPEPRPFASSVSITAPLQPCAAIPWYLAAVPELSLGLRLASWEVTKQPEGNRGFLHEKAIDSQRWWHHSAPRKDRVYPWLMGKLGTIWLYSLIALKLQYLTFDKNMVLPCLLKESPWCDGIIWDGLMCKISFCTSYINLVFRDFQAKSIDLCIFSSFYFIAANA